MFNSSCLSVSCEATVFKSSQTTSNHYFKIKRHSAPRCSNWIADDLNLKKETSKCRDRTQRQKWWRDVSSSLRGLISQKPRKSGCQAHSGIHNTKTDLLRRLNLFPCLTSQWVQCAAFHRLVLSRTGNGINYAGTRTRSKRKMDTVGTFLPLEEHICWKENWTLTKKKKSTMLVFRKRRQMENE